MKKKYLAVFIVPTMLAAGPANAAFVESTDGTFAGQLDFLGTVIDKAPNWKWQIPEASVAKASNWELIKTNATENGANTEWDLTSKGSIDFLQGFMQASVAKGRPGLTPVVTVAGELVEQSLESKLFSIPVTGTLMGVATATPGVLTGTYTQIYGSSFFQHSSRTIYSESNQTYRDLAVITRDLLSARIAELQAKNPHISVEFGAATNNGVGRLLSGMSSLAAMDISASIATSLSDFKISFPTNDIPDQWNASIPVAITLQ